MSKSCYPFCYNDMTTWLWQISHDQPALVPLLLFTRASHRADTLLLHDSSARDVRKIVRHSLQLRSQAIQSLQEMLSNPRTACLESAVAPVGNMLCSDVRIYDTFAGRLFSAFFFFFFFVKLTSIRPPKGT